MARTKFALARPLRVKAHSTKPIVTAPKSPARLDQTINFQRSVVALMGKCIPPSGFSQGAAVIKSGFNRLFPRTKTPSNMPHFGGVAGKEIFDGAGFERDFESGAYIPPDGGHARTGLSGRGGRSLEHFGIHHAHDVVKGNFCGRAGEGIAALFAAAADDEAAVAQFVEDLHQIIGGDGLGLGERLDVREACATVAAGQLAQHAAGVFDLERNFHKHLRYKCSPHGARAKRGRDKWLCPFLSLSELNGPLKVPSYDDDTDTHV